MKKHHTNTHRNGFKTPDNYFENSQQKIINRLNIEAETSSETKVVSLISTNVKYAMYIAASIILVVGITFSFSNNETTKNQITLVSDTLNKVNDNLQLNFEKDKNDDELLALFVEDEYLDEYLDDYLMDGVILQ